MFLPAFLLAPLVVIPFQSGGDIPGMLASIYLGPLMRPHLLGSLLDTMLPAGLAALGFCAARHAGMFHLGLEGAIAGGGLVTATAGLFLGGTGVPGLLLLALLAAASGSAGGAFSDLLRRRLGIQEIISTYLVSLMTLSLSDSLVSGPLRNPAGQLLSTAPLPADLALPGLLPPSTLHAGIFLLPAATAWLVWFLGKTRTGYHMRLVEANPDFASSQGLRPDRFRLLALVISGGLGGLSGFFLTAGTHHAAYAGMSGGLGWTGIAAAMLGGRHPVMVLATTFLLVWLQTGVKSAALYAGLGNWGAMILQGAVMLAAALAAGRRKA